MPRADQELLEAKMISPIAPEDIKCISPIIMAPKKDGLRTSYDELNDMIADALAGVDRRPLKGDPTLLRLCQNFFTLNQATEVPPFLPGDLNEKVARHSKKRYRMKLDATSGFFNIALDPDSRAYTAMFVEGMGFFAWNVMPMGLTGAPTTYQLGMDEPFKGLIGQGKKIDIWVADFYASADTFEEMLEILEDLLKRAEEWGVKLAPKKSELFFDEMTIAGQLVFAKGVSPDPSKVLTIADSEYPRPKTVRDVMSFMGRATYQRRFIKDFASIAAPLTDLTQAVDCDKKDPRYNQILDPTPVVWGQAQGEAFQKIKCLLASSPVVHPPLYNQTPAMPFHVATDAWATGYGAHLYQERDGVKYTVAYASEKNVVKETARSAYEQESMAVRYALEEFKPFIYGQHIIVHTDCKAVRDS